MDNRVRSHSTFFRTFKCVKGAILTWTCGSASLSCWRQLCFGSSLVSGRTFDGLAPILALAHVMAQRRSSRRIAARRQRSLGAKLALLCVVLSRVAFATPRLREDLEAPRRCVSALRSGVHCRLLLSSAALTSRCDSYLSVASLG